VSLRLLYMIFVRLCGWLVLPGRASASKDIELLVRRDKVAALRRTKPRPRLDWANRTILAALTPLPPRTVRVHGVHPGAPSRGGTVAWSERDGPTRTGQAAHLSAQLRKWPAPQLTLRLLDLHGKNGNLSRAEDLVRQVVPDPSFPDSVRLDLCEWYTARKGSQGSLAEAAAFAEQGLAIGDHPGLAWNLVKVLNKDGKITRAREALSRYLLGSNTRSWR
jgi:hypothetical protein